MKKHTALLMICTAMAASLDAKASSEGETDDMGWTSHILNHKRCKEALIAEQWDHPGIAASDKQLDEYRYGQRCIDWSISTIIALQTVDAICDVPSIGEAGAIIALFYDQYPAEVGERMVVTFAKVTSILYACE